MAEVLHTRKRGNSLAIVAVAVVVAALLLWGIWTFLNSHREVRRNPGTITHSTPVGGKIEDGVFRSLPQSEEPGLIRWQI
jgi:hypothetical protein